MSVVVVVHRQANLLQVVFAASQVGGLADFLHGRQQHSDQYSDDGDDHEQFDECKGRLRKTTSNHGDSPIGSVELPEFQRPQIAEPILPSPFAAVSTDNLTFL